MFIRKKKYNELIAERDKWDSIASEAVAQNGRLLTQIDSAIKEMKSIQKLNHNLQQSNEVLLAYTKELEAKLDFAIKQRDYYYGLLENTEGVHVGDVVVKEAE
jgi:16S rRNA U1498 N3-methylase RsmE